MKEQNNKEKITLFNIVRKLFPVMWKACPGLFIVSIIFNILRGTSIGYLIYLSEKLYDIINSSVNGNTSKQGVIIMVLIYGIVMITSQIINGINVYIMQVIFELIVMNVTYRVHKKAGMIEPIFYEKDNVYNDINKALSGVDDCLGLIFIVFTPLTFHLPLFLFMFWYLSGLKPQLVLMVLLIFIPVLLSYLYKIMAKEKLEDESVGVRRDMDYYQKCIVDRIYYKETRILGAFHLIFDRYMKSLSILNKKEKKYKKNNTKINILSKIITLIGYGGILFMLVRYLLAGDISIGAFVAVFSGINILFDEVKGLVCDDIGDSIMNLSTVRNLLRFLNLKEIRNETEPHESCNNEFVKMNSVYFKYPSSEDYVIKNINLTINCGEKIAIVGENGCGKTTLTKLLLGIYLPDKGTIYQGGQSVEKIGFKCRYNNKSAVFQDYQRYKMSLKENINISCLKKQGDEEELKKVLEETDFGLTDNISYDTNLSVEFGGTDLSGGQWQRVALARGIYRDSDIIVLDEPTSAIDPLEETKIYKEFIEITKQRTAILVTHRLGAAKIANKIITMDKGRIVDIGSHDELLNRCEIYRRLYNAQAQWYITE